MALPRELCSVLLEMYFLDVGVCVSGMDGVLAVLSLCYYLCNCSGVAAYLCFVACCVLHIPNEPTSVGAD